MTTKVIKAIGNFLATYEKDLIYIRSFQRYRQNKISSNDFVADTDGMFYRFLVEFRVVRNFDKGKSEDILYHTKDWIEKDKDLDIDGLAVLLKNSGLTRNMIMTSLASKILFLNNPYKVFPLDKQTKETLQHKIDNLYVTFLPLVEKYKKENSEFIKTNLITIKTFFEKIEFSFKDELKNIEVIRENRFIDNLLWTGIN